MKIHKILFITLSNIGDVVLTLPVFSALRDNFPEAKIDVVVGPRPRDIFKKDPRVNKIIVYDKHGTLKTKLDFIKQLRSEKYDLAVDMRSSIIPLLIGARKRNSLFYRPDKTIRHKKLLHLNKLKELGIAYREQKNIFIDEDARGRITRLLEENGVCDGDVLIGICPSSRSPLKEWRKQGFIDLSINLLKDGEYKIILMGDSSEVKFSEEIMEGCGCKGIIDLTGKTDLNELAGLIERLSVLITCDSAGLHIASDLGVKVVTIFGPTDPGEYGPRGEYDVIIRKDIKCSPCKKAQCRFNHECMEQISSGELYEAVKKVLL